MRQSNVLLLVGGVVLVSAGIIGLVISSNNLAIYNLCSTTPNGSYRCYIYSNPGAMNDYWANMTLEAGSGISAAVGFILAIGAILTDPGQNQGS